MKPFLPVPFFQPSIGEEEIEEVVATLRSGWLTTGPRTERFERDFAAYVEARHALAVNSCSAGLHLALAALDIGEGDEVITTPMTFCATVNAILHARATPVLADVGHDGNLDVRAVRDRVTSRTKAILPVHVAGVPCDLQGLREVAREHGLRVVEDAAHAVGTHHGGAPIGADPTSDAVVFSFYATKNLTTGEGGMVTTHDGRLSERMRRLSRHGISADAWSRSADRRGWFYEVAECGFKYNLPDVLAAIGIHQLRRQEEFLAARSRVAEFYNRAFEGIPGLETPPNPAGARHAWHLYVLRLRGEELAIGRDEFIAQLGARGIGTSVHFIPIPLHPAYRELCAEERNRCPRAIELYQRIVSLPLYPELRAREMEHVADSVIAIAGAHARVKSLSMRPA